MSRDRDPYGPPPPRRESMSRRDDYPSPRDDYYSTKDRWVCPFNKYLTTLFVVGYMFLILTFVTLLIYTSGMFSHFDSYSSRDYTSSRDTRDYAPPPRDYPQSSSRDDYGSMSRGYRYV